MKYDKTFELVIRTQADEEKLREMLDAGWKILNRVYVEQVGEPTRAEYHLYKEESPGK